jgi:hypothetical protein
MCRGGVVCFIYCVCGCDAGHCGKGHSLWYGYLCRERNHELSFYVHKSDLKSVVDRSLLHTFGS